jgi:hypothetical protein
MGRSAGKGQRFWAFLRCNRAASGRVQVAVGSRTALLPKWSAARPRPGLRGSGSLANGAERLRRR